MQKKLIALAIAGLSSAAFAQSNVTISGQIKTGYTNYKTSDTTANGSTNSFTDQTSAFVLSGTESLGNGLSAIFRIDTRFTPDQAGSATSVGDGNTHVGLKGSFGEIKIGRQDLHYNEQERIDAGVNTLSQQYSVTRNLLSGVGGGNNAGTRLGAGNTRTNNAIIWDSANYSGFTARAAYSTGFTTTENDQSIVANAQEAKLYNLVGRYENGPLKAGISYLKAEYGTTATNAFQRQDTGTKAWIGYTLAGVNFGLAYDQSEIENAAGNAAAKAKRNAWAIPVSYKTGNHGLYAAYAKAGDLETLAGKTANSGAKQWSLGYDYSLSKRTSVGVNYTRIDNETGASYGFFHQGNTGTAAAAGNLTAGTAGLTNGATYSQLYAGVRHAF